MKNRRDMIHFFINILKEIFVMVPELAADLLGAMKTFDRVENRGFLSLADK